MTIDHFIPKAKGGTDDTDNLVYACHACNEFKGDYWPGDDSLQLLHPLHDDISEHLQEDSDGILVALTARGRIYCDQLRLNRPPLIAYRRTKQLQERNFQEQVLMNRTLLRMLDFLFGDDEQTPTQ